MIQNFSITVLTGDIFITDNMQDASSKMAAIEKKYDGKIKFIQSIVTTPVLIKDGD